MQHLFTDAGDRAADLKTGLNHTMNFLRRTLIPFAAASLLFGVSSTDVATFLSVPALLAAVAFAATALPAWRASNVDPIVALRED